MNINEYTFEEPMPFGRLSIIAMKGCEEIAARIDYYLKEWRKDANGIIYSNGSGPIRTFLLDAACPVSYTHLDVYKRQVTYGAQCQSPTKIESPGFV